MYNYNQNKKSLTEVYSHLMNILIVISRYINSLEYFNNK